MHEAIFNYNTHQASVYDPTNFGTHFTLRLKWTVYQIVENIQKTVPFDEKVHLIDCNQTITYVECDCGITFFPLARTKVNLIKGQRNILQNPVKTPSSSHVMIYKTVLLMKSITLEFSWIPAVYGTSIQQLVCHSHTLLTEILCAFSILKHQRTNIKEIFMSSILFLTTDRK